MTQLDNDLNAHAKIILDKINNKIDVTLDFITLNKKYGVPAIVKWLENNFDNSTAHQVFSRILHDYTQGCKDLQYKGRILKLWAKWKP